MPAKPLASFRPFLDQLYLRSFEIIKAAQNSIPESCTNCLALTKIPTGFRDGLHSVVIFPTHFVIFVTFSILFSLFTLGFFSSPFVPREKNIRHQGGRKNNSWGRVLHHSKKNRCLQLDVCFVIFMISDFPVLI